MHALVPPLLPIHAILAGDDVPVESVLGVRRRVGPVCAGHPIPIRLVIGKQEPAAGFAEEEAAPDAVLEHQIPRRQARGVVSIETDEAPR